MEHELAYKMPEIFVAKADILLSKLEIRNFFWQQKYFFLKSIREVKRFPAELRSRATFL